MKLYYYEYETSVFSAWDNCKYYLYSGFLIESSLGVIDFESECPNSWYESIEDFKKEINTQFPKNFNIVELE